MKGLLLPPLAVLAGVISFSSPCCPPLIPGYLSYVSGLPVSDRITEAIAEAGYTAQPAGAAERDA